MLKRFLDLIRSFFFISFIHLVSGKHKDRLAKKGAGSDPVGIIPLRS